MHGRKKGLFFLLTIPLILLVLTFIRPEAYASIYPDPPSGWVDNADGSVCKLVGWTCDQDNYPTALGINFYLQGQTSPVQGSITANKDRPDLSGVCGGYTLHGFSYTFPDGFAYRDRANHCYDSTALGVNDSGVADGLNTILGGVKCMTCCPAMGVPAPSYTCLSNGNQVRVDWPAVSNATYYSVRLDDMDDGSTWSCVAGVCDDLGLGVRTVTYNIDPAHDYNFWIHARNECGSWGNAVSISFKCATQRSACSMGSELLTNPDFSSDSSGWGAWNGQNTVESYGGDKVTIQSTGNGNGCWSQDLSGLAGKKIRIQGSLNKSTAMSGNPYIGVNTLHPLGWTNNDGGMFSTSTVNGYETTTGDITISSDTTTVRPFFCVSGAAASYSYADWISLCLIPTDVPTPTPTSTPTPTPWVEAAIRDPGLNYVSVFIGAASYDCPVHT
ncbi:hypothetical protein COY59_05525, partial [Candidatus Gottesmanbacteria bacterium CG_4_10_14_0_8_um_filter_37_24]